VFLTKFRDSINFPELQQIHSVTNDLIIIINNIETRMVGVSEGDPGNPLENPPQVIQTEMGQTIVYEELSRPFHQTPVEDFPPTWISTPN